MTFKGNVVCGCLVTVHYSVTMVDSRPYSCHISFGRVCVCVYLRMKSRMLYGEREKRERYTKEINTKLEFGF